MIYLVMIVYDREKYHTIGAFREIEQMKESVERKWQRNAGIINE